jgi:hypothetical protein
MHRSGTEYAKDQVTRFSRRTPRDKGDEFTIRLVRYDNGIVMVGKKVMNGPPGAKTADEIQELAKLHLRELADAFFSMKAS